MAGRANIEVAEIEKGGFPAIAQHTNQPTDATSPLTNRPTNLLTDLPTDKPTNQQISGSPKIGWKGKEKAHALGRLSVKMARKLATRIRLKTSKRYEGKRE